MLGAAAWALPALIAATIISGVATAGPKITDPLVLELDIGADSLCRLWGTSMNCEEVGPYLRDTLHVPVSTDIHLAVLRTWKYEVAAKMLESLNRAGYQKLGFVVGPVSQPAAPN